MVVADRDRAHGAKARDLGDEPAIDAIAAGDEGAVLAHQPPRQLLRIPGQIFLIRLDLEAPGKARKVFGKQGAGDQDPLAF